MLDYNLLIINIVLYNYKISLLLSNENNAMRLIAKFEPYKFVIWVSILVANNSGLCTIRTEIYPWC